MWPVIRMHDSVQSCRFSVANGTLWDTELISWSSICLNFSFPNSWFSLSSSKCFDLFHPQAPLFVTVSPGWSLFLYLSFLSLPHLLYFTAPISHIISSLSKITPCVIASLSWKMKAKFQSVPFGHVLSSLPYMSEHWLSWDWLLKAHINVCASLWCPLLLGMSLSALILSWVTNI